jgi:hypothetical protein
LVCRKKVLIVDDDPSILKLARMRLGSDAIEMLTARGGAEGLFRGGRLRTAGRPEAAVPCSVLGNAQVHCDSRTGHGKIRGITACTEIRCGETTIDPGCRDPDRMLGVAVEEEFAERLI